MEVWSLINSKGGSGKTTLAINLAASLARMFKVIVIDTDEQQSALTWGDVRPEDKAFPIVGCSQNNLLASLVASLNDFDYVIIDTPGNLSNLTFSSAKVATHILIPIQPSGLDYWASRLTMEFIEGWKNLNPELKVAIILTMADLRTRAPILFREELASAPFPLLSNHTSLLKDYTYAMNAGLCVYGYGFQRGIDEIEVIRNEIMRLNK